MAAPPSPADPRTDPRVDTYIDRAAPFARPILAHLREVMHSACPTVTETMKWSMPFFMLDGAILASMAGFKQHCAIRFWKGRGGPEATDDDAQAEIGDTAGDFRHIARLEDLPPRRELTRLFKAAAVSAQAARAATPVAPRIPFRKPPPETPDDLSDALQAHPAARKTFDAFPPGQRREYVEWLTEAKRPETRARRLAQTLEWLAEGKERNWKYEAC